MRRRGTGDGGAPPRFLLDLAVWMAEGRSPDPGPAPHWWDREEPYTVSEARREWSRARRQWVRENARTLDDVNALYAEGFNDLSPDPRHGDYERTVMLAVTNPQLLHVLRDGGGGSPGAGEPDDLRDQGGSVVQ